VTESIETRFFSPVLPCQISHSTSNDNGRKRRDPPEKNDP